MPSTLSIGALAAVSALATLCLVEVARRTSLHLALLDLPNSRSSHVEPTPRTGGLACAVVLLVGLAGLSWLPDVDDHARLALRVVTLIGTVVALVSLIDDLRPLDARARLLVHLAAGVAVSTLVGPVSVVDAGPVGRLVLTSPWSELVTVVWVAGFINAFNFMDGIDGIAGGQAVVAGVGWCLMGAIAGAPIVVLTGALLVGTSVGFLMHNWSPARIFLGDAGSASLGLLLATIPWTVGPAALWLASAFLVWPFVFDTSFTLMRRLMRHERIWEAHRSHLYQRIVINGNTHSSVAALYLLLASVGVVAATSTMTSALRPFVLATGAILLSAVALWLLASLPERKRP